MTYYERYRLCDPRGILALVLAVDACSKAFSAVSLGHGKSPWFSRVAVLSVNGVGWRVRVFGFADGGFFHD